MKNETNAPTHIEVRGGVHGGRIVKSGTPEQLMDCSESLTGHYLRQG